MLQNSGVIWCEPIIRKKADFYSIKARKRFFNILRRHFSELMFIDVCYECYNTFHDPVTHFIAEKASVHNVEIVKDK